MKEFDLLTSPLEGSLFIEAGAGTGKTYAIAGLVLRLVAERGLAIDEILVVTFTNAATAELRDRIRKTLRRALSSLVRKEPAEADLFLRSFAEELSDTGTARRRIEKALRDFDSAAVHTIHSFCLRTLHEQAFESRSPFDADLLADEGALRREIIQDFWRRSFYDVPLELIARAEEMGWYPAKLERDLAQALQPSSPRLEPVPEPVRIEGLEELRSLFLSMKEAWPGARQEVLERLASPSLRQTRYRHRLAYAQHLDRYAEQVCPLPVPDSLREFTPQALASQTKKPPTPEHAFFALCGNLWDKAQQCLENLDACLQKLRADLLTYLRSELPRRKESQRRQAYDDLLTRLHEALHRPGCEALVIAVRKRFRAALIDEFQDTDPLQYAIFRRLFQGKDTSLFLIGDPKQAIYGFRGADLFTYLQARREIGRHYTLTRNWRSDSGLLQAVNTLFTWRSHPFIVPEIPCPPLMPADRRDLPPPWLHPREAPFSIFLLEKEALVGAEKSRSRTNDLIARGTAARIAALVRGDGSGRIPCPPGAIAVLVRFHREARLIQKALRDLGVPQILQNAGNVFDAPEAEDMERIASALAFPGREDLVRTALITAPLGLTAEDLSALEINGEAWEERLLRFRIGHERWIASGFMVMFRQFLNEEGVRERLLGRIGGLRSLTNLFHLAELLHEEETSRKPGLAGLLRWLARQRDPETRIGEREGHELRLESDVDAVRIVTVHKSKGLEYPVVFCPFLWTPSSVGDTFTYHERDRDTENWQVRLVLNGKNSPHRSQAEREALAENLRLLYVAVTRARHCCSVVWGPFKDAGSSALAYLLHPQRDGRGMEGPVESLEAMKTRFEGLDPAVFRADLERLALVSDGAIRIEGLLDVPPQPVPPPCPPLPHLSCHPFAGRIEKRERIASFSYLAAGHGNGLPLPQEGLLDEPDHDGTAWDDVRLPMATEGDRSGLFAFPRGTRAGTALHAILERIEFRDSDRSQWEEIAAAQLQAHGFAPDWRHAVADMIEALVCLPLELDGRSLTLDRIGPQDRIREMAFHLPLNLISPERLRRIFEGRLSTPLQAFPERLARLGFQPTLGYLKGYIDLVFRFKGRYYLIDWKSNDLGNRPEDYTPGVLARAMTSELYVLQYHLYTVALHRFLKARLQDYDYDRHMGGVFYLFLRGIAPGWGLPYGIFSDRPQQKWLEAIEKGLSGETDGRTSGKLSGGFHGP